MISRSLMISILVLVAMSPPAHATLTFFNNGNAANFNSANPSLTIEPLETFNLALSGSPLIYTDSNGIQFFGFNLGGGTNSTANDLSISSTALQQATNGGIIEITNFPANVFAFAANISILSGFANFCTLEVNNTSYNTGADCNQLTFINGSSDQEFVGVQSSVPITSLWFGPLGSSGQLQINSFEIGDTGSGGGSSDTPEVSTLILMGGGLIFLRFLRRPHWPGAAPSR